MYFKLIQHSKPTVGDEECSAVSNLIREGTLSSGMIVAKFEKQIADYTGVKYAVALNSGTTAIQLALESLSLSKKEVIFPVQTCPAVAYAIIRAGCIPYIVDIGDQNYNITVEQIKKNISPNTGAIILPHMYGCPIKLEEIKEFAEEHGVKLIEDCAQSIGAKYNGKKVGSFGDISCFSFYATKMMTTGEGGMITTNNEDIARHVAEIRTCSLQKSDKLMRGDFDFTDRSTSLRGNFKMTDIQAAMGLEQLKKLERFIRCRKAIAEKYNNAFKDIARLVEIPAGCDPVFYRYILHVKDPVGLLKRLQQSRIICSVFYPSLNNQPIARRCKLASEFPNNDRFVRSAISIPIYPSLSGEEQEYIIDTVSNCIKST